MSAEHPYPTTSQVKLKINLPGDFSDANKKSCYDILGQMLALNPKKRINATAALSHKYFTSEFPLPSPKSLGKLDYPKNKPKPLSVEQMEKEKEKEKEWVNSGDGWGKRKHYNNPLNSNKRQKRY